MAMSSADITAITTAVANGTYTMTNALNDIANSETGKDVRKSIYAEGLLAKNLAASSAASAEEAAASVANRMPLYYQSSTNIDPDTLKSTGVYTPVTPYAYTNGVVTRSPVAYACSIIVIQTGAYYYQICLPIMYTNTTTTPPYMFIRNGYGTSDDTLVWNEWKECNLDTIAADSILVERNDHILDALWRINQGQTYKFEEVTNTGVSAYVPSGTKMVSFSSLGTISTIDPDNGGFLSGLQYIRVRQSTSVVDHDISMMSKGHFSNYDGFGHGAGTARNTIDMTTKKYTKKAAVIEDLSTLSWTAVLMTSGLTGFYTVISDISLGTQNLVISDTGYEITTYAALTNTKYTDESQKYIACRNNDNHRVQIYDPACTTVAQIKSALSKVSLCYELATPVETDIADEDVEYWQENLETIDVDTGWYISFRATVSGTNTTTVNMSTEYTIECVEKLSEASS